MTKTEQDLEEEVSDLDEVIRQVDATIEDVRQDLRYFQEERSRLLWKKYELTKELKELRANPET